MLVHSGHRLFYILFPSLFWLVSLTYCAPLHDREWAFAGQEPRRISLSLSRRNITIGSQTVAAVVFNDSFPGPTIRLFAEESER